MGQSMSYLSTGKRMRVLRCRGAGESICMTCRIAGASKGTALEAPAAPSLTC